MTLVNEQLLTKTGKPRKRKPKTKNNYFTKETEEAILNSLFTAHTITGTGGRTVQALPVDRVLAQGLRTGDLMAEGCTLVGCRAMGDHLLAALEG